jgi:hypothetical protein
LQFLLETISKDHYCVDYKTPDQVVLIEITHDLLCMSVLEDYFDNKCYNLFALAKTDQELQKEREILMKKQQESESRKNNQNNSTIMEDNNIVNEANKTEVNKIEDNEEKDDIDII